MKKILVLDDQKAIRDLVSLMLSLNGFEVVAVSCGEQAIRLYQDGARFDAAILDIDNPIGLGARLTLPALKKFDPAIRAVVFSGDHTYREIKNPKKYGFAAALTKPFGVFQLLSSLQEAES